MLAVIVIASLTTTFYLLLTSDTDPEDVRGMLKSEDWFN